MKKIKILPILILLLGSAHCAFSQSAPYPSVLGYWEGTWSVGYTYNIYLDTDDKGKIKGTVTWTISHFDYQENIMKSHQPKEFLEGTYNEKTGVLQCRTVGEDDPENDLSPALYFLKMDESGAEMRGYTTPLNSTYQSPITMSRTRA